MDPQLELFLDLSSRLTGFGKSRLQSTGLLEEHYAFFVQHAIEPCFPGDPCGFWRHWVGVGAGPFTERRVEEVMADPRGSLICKNIVRLWLLGTWLPDPPSPSSAFVASARAYQEGLLWSCIGAHPAGAKQPGYGSWSLRPRV